MRSRATIVLCAAALGLVLAGTGCYDDDDGFWFPELDEVTLTGQVTDQATGDPLEDARVEVDGRIDFTDDDGFYRIEDLRRHDERVEVSRPGYESLARDVDLDEVVEVEDFALRRL